MKRGTIGVRCPNCGCTLDYGERCDCERLEAERKQQKEHRQRQKTLRRNMEQAIQAQLEWLWR